MGKLRTGDGRRSCDMGPLVTREHRDKVASYIDIAEKDGATVVVDGRNPKVDRPINAVYAHGGGTMSENNAIRNNNIYNYLNPSTSSYGINIRLGNSGLNISGNSFYETTNFITTTTSVQYCIYISSSNGNGFTIAGNFIGGSEPLCAGTPWTKSGSNNMYYNIWLSTAGVTANSIQGNTIQNISWTNSGNGSLYGIYISGSSVVNLGTLKGNTIGAAT